MKITWPGPAKWNIWHVPRHRHNPWVVVRPNLTVVGYFRTFEQARRAFIGDTIAERNKAGAL